MTWSQFLKAHWNVLAAADFFTIEVWGPRGLVTFYVFFVIELATRRIEIAGIMPRSPFRRAYRTNAPPRSGQQSRNAIRTLCRTNEDKCRIDATSCRSREGL